MSAPPSPRIGHASLHSVSQRQRDRPAALHLPEEDRKAVSDGEVRYERAGVKNAGQDQLHQQPQQQQFDLNVSAAEDSSMENEPERTVSRSTSATSTLDPYYFGIQSESDEPVPPLPTSHTYLSPTPEYQQPMNEPTTPARNPAMIDRRGLVGVGELATPRWARPDKHQEELDLSILDAEAEGYDVVVPESYDGDSRDVPDPPDSPWTIEAVDGELSEKEELAALQSPPRQLRNKASIADESGGEEILYPRNYTSPKADHFSSSDDTPKLPRTNDKPLTTPPSAFSHSSKTARKRTSDEFELDQTGSLVSKSFSSPSLSKDKSKEDKTAAARKHRSLNVSTSSNRDSKGKERRRESSLTLSNNIKSPASVRSPEKHMRQASAGSTSSNHDAPHSRRVQATDFSHLPPSPSSNSIQHFLRNAGATSGPATPLHRPSKDNLHAHTSPNVAHSLLRGTQEGWSSLDDEATAEALRKLDGLTGKGARARASVSSFGRPGSSSRPVTPASKSGSQWEGLSASDSGKSKRGSKDNGSVKDKADLTRSGTNTIHPEAIDLTEGSAIATSSDDQLVHVSVQEKTPKKTTGVRLSFTPKRGSTSSTTYTGTPSSRDSASMSATTSITSVSATSGRQSSSKARRNSAGSDISSVHSSDAAFRDRVASIALNGDMTDEAEVPPVPPLPKDLSNYRSPPATASSGLTFPTIPNEEKSKTDGANTSHSISLDVNPYTSPVVSPRTSSSGPSGRRESVHYSSASGNESLPIVKTPSKKWSFSSALSLKLGTPSSKQQQSSSSFPISPRSVTFGQQIRKSTSKDQGPTSATSPTTIWSPNEEAMSSAQSLASLSSVGSIKSPTQPPHHPTKTPEKPSRPGTGSSVSTNHTTSGLAAPQGPLSPSSSIRRSHSKRLTPSSIPFFSRRSSSQSMQLPPPHAGLMQSTSPTATYSGLLSAQTPRKHSSSPTHEMNAVSTPGTSHKKSSIMSLGLPSLLKSSSRRSLHSDAKESDKEVQKAKTAAREAEKERAKAEKAQAKKDEKDRSESRISVIMNRKRGKTLSSTEPRKQKSPVTNLPPMQISALEPATAQRVAKLKTSTNSTPASSVSNRASVSSSSSRLTSQTVSSMQKQSDSSLRSRNLLPTIAGSPSVATTGTSSSQTLKDGRDPASLANSLAGLPKETPTKIPRISSRTSAASAAAPSPPLKNSGSALATRRTSGLAASSTNASPTSFSTSEFGVIDDDGATPKVRQPSTRASPSTAATTSVTTSRVPRQSTSGVSASTASSARKNRDSVSFIGLRKASTTSVSSLSTPTSGGGTSASAAEPAPTSHRLSMLSPSKGFKLLAPKASARASTSGVNRDVPPVASSPSGSGSGRQSLSTPSPVPSAVDEEELLGDEEMLHYIRRQHAKKLASGATQAELDEMLKFPEPQPPGTPSSPASLLKSSQSNSLSEYEKKEILDYPSVYCIGAGSRKKLATVDNSTNNHGYDDERGDYLVVNHDHLAYRYEVMDTLGKGSFGQVLNCRDHCTGESVAIKIIRNKKRFHHQALVEIKILDNLRKWDADEKHHVIKMTEHFYFRNHLCIAMELLSINLYELIKANGFVGFTTALIRRFTSQMLMSLSLMRHHRIVHCDLKPENVLLRHPAKSGIKVIDFGSSCFEHEKIYTYIQSRFYRSPEVILGMNYHMAIDMWSLGCILAELYTGFPIFPGENEQEQLSCIMEVLGIPDKDFVNRSSRRKLFFDSNGVPRTVINSKGRRRRPGSKTLQQVLRCNDEEFVDFVAKCLVWDPERRMKPQAALRHPFVTGGRKPKIPTTIGGTRSTASTSSLSSRSKHVTETPKKSLIGAPVPLTARTTRTTNGVPTTPITGHQPLVSASATTSRSYRSSQTQLLSSLNTSRTLSGYASSTNK